MASNAIDGNTDQDFSNGSCTHTNEPDGTQAFWRAEFDSTYEVDRIQIWNRTDLREDRLGNFEVFTYLCRESIWTVSRNFHLLKNM